MGGSRWSRRRAEEQWQRELLREIRALETADGAKVTPIRGRLPRPPRQRRRRPPRERAGGERRRTFTTITVTASVVLALVLFNLSPGAAQVRSWLGIDDRVGSRVDGDGKGSYAFLATRRGTNQPVGWSPCREIDYVVNPDGAPDDWEELVGDSIAVITEATGLVFDDGGTTDDRDFDDRVSASGGAEPVLIGWADDNEVDGLAGDIAGLAGPMTANHGSGPTYVSGRVILDRDVFGDLDRRIGGGDEQRAIVIHELGHLVGLDHVEDSSQLMYRTTSVTELGAGDLSGLAILGDTPCR